MGYQQIILFGNLTEDVKVRPVGQNQHVGSTGIAVTEKFRKADGTMDKTTEFFDIEIWNMPNVYPYLAQGANVLVVGTQKTSSYTDQQGQKHTVKKIRVNTIQLGGGRPQTAPQPQAPTQAPQYPQPPVAPPSYPQAPQYAAPAPAPMNAQGETPDDDLPF